MRVVIATASPDALAAEAQRYGHETHLAADAEGIREIVSATSVDLAVVSASDRFLTEAVLAHCDSRGVRLIVLIASDAERRYASGLGLYEFADATATWSTLELQLTGAARTTAADGTAAPADTRGQVVAVWGPAGAPGRTSIAIGVAAELAEAGYSVALCDVDTHGASIAPALGMLDEAPGFAAACRLAGANALTRTELERIGQRYEVSGGGFWVLTGIGRPSRWPELSGERVKTAVDACRGWVDFTILDTGFSIETDEEISSDLFAPKRNGATIAALRAADTILAVGAADPVGMSRFLRTHVDLIETVETDRVSVVMNKLRASAIGLNPAGQVAQTLARFGGIDAAALVPWDQAGYDAAILSGRTLAEVAPKSPARLAVRQLVHTRLLGSRTPALARRLLGGRVGAASA